MMDPDSTSRTRLPLPPRGLLGSGRGRRGEGAIREQQRRGRGWEGGEEAPLRAPFARLKPLETPGTRCSASLR